MPQIPKLDYKITTGLKSHFDGRHYHNQYPFEPERSMKEIMKWSATRKPAKWPHHVSVKAHSSPQTSLLPGQIQVIYVNHATVLIQTTTLNILTDPIWSERCSPFTFIGPKRVAPPGLSFDDLPRIDAVLVSHNHYDHLDLPTLKKLSAKHNPAFFVAKGNRNLLVKNGLKQVLELDWWEERKIFEKEKLTFVPSQHFSRRGLRDGNKTLWGGFVLEGLDHAPLYFAGDTGYGTHFKAIQRHFNFIGLAFLPIGAYEPRWFMKSVHMNPEDAVLAHLDLKAEQSMGIHFGTFQLTDEAYDSPIIDLNLAIDKYSLSKESFVALKNGESRLWYIPKDLKEAGR